MSAITTEGPGAASADDAAADHAEAHAKTPAYSWVVLGMLVCIYEGHVLQRESNQQQAAAAAALSEPPPAAA